MPDSRVPLLRGLTTALAFKRNSRTPDAVSRRAEPRDARRPGAVGPRSWKGLAALGIALICAVAGFPAPAGATGGLQAGYCKSWQYACVGGGYAATAATTGNSWAWRYYGEQGAGGIGTKTGPHNCTLYAAWRLQGNGVANPGTSWGNASQWGTKLASKTNKVPAVGSIAWWSSGHVAYVEEVSADRTRVRIAADNYVPSGGYTDAGWVAVSTVTGFIHIKDVGPSNGYEVAFQANTGSMWAVGGGGASGPGDLRLGMMPGTSPSIARLASGGYVVAFQANTGSLWVVGAGGASGPGDLRLGMMPGTSPSIAALSSGGWEVAFQANTSSLWTVGSDSHGAWNLGMKSGTSPSISRG